MEKKLQYSICGSSLSFNICHKEDNPNLYQVPDGEFYTEDKCEEELEPLNKSLTSMEWLQKLNADYVTQTNSDSDQLKNSLNKHCQYSIGGSGILFDKKKFPSHEEDNQNNWPTSGGEFAKEDSLESQNSSDHEKKKFYACLRWPYKCTVCDASFSQEKCTKPQITSVHDKKEPYKRSVHNGSQAKFNEVITIITTDDESDLEGTSPSTSKLSTSSASSGNGSKKEFSIKHYMNSRIAAVHESTIDQHNGSKTNLNKIINITTDNESYLEIDLESNLQSDLKKSKLNISSASSGSGSKKEFPIKHYMNSHIAAIHESIEQHNGSKTNLNEVINITTDDESYLEGDLEIDIESDLGSDLEKSKQNTSGASSGRGSKKVKKFWLYNLQGKGPKHGEKITFETSIKDPHVLSDIVDPVFSDEVQLQGIKESYLNKFKHKGKGRKGEGNDLTSNPKKLAAIGKELDKLTKKINDFAPTEEIPFGARYKSRKEKNKLSSRVCRLKKKAKHEANKLKCEGLTTEHNDLIAGIAKTKALLLEKANPNSVRSQQEITDELDIIVSKATSHNVAGSTSNFVHRMIEKHMSEV